MKYDFCIIGAGITGTAIAMELAKYDVSTVVLEKENDVCLGTSKANSAIIHAGYDPLPNTLMAKLDVRGSELTYKLHEKLNFHYQQIGSLVIGKDDDRELIQTLYERGIKNGVKDLKILSKEELFQLEENLNDDISIALFAKTAAIVSPWEMALSFISTAIKNGVTLKTNSKVIDIEHKGEEYLIKTEKESVVATYVIDAAGLFADDIYTCLTKTKEFEITAIKGEYFLLDKVQGKLFNHVIFQTPSKLGKGVLVSKTVHGNLIVGPNALETPEKDRVNVTSDGLNTVREKAKLTSVKINLFDNIRNFAGNRATIKGIDDFYIKESEKYPNFYLFAGIKSPGLSSALAFGEYLLSLLQKKGITFKKKEDFEYYRLPTYFKELSLEEKEKKIKENELYGRVICRCETITEGEIVSAIHSIIPTYTIDGIKRRCNAGMGRCQGGFCGPKIFEIIKRETGRDYSKIYQDKEGSYVVACKTKGEK